MYLDGVRAAERKQDSSLLAFRGGKFCSAGISAAGLTPDRHLLACVRRCRAAGPHQKRKQCERLTVGRMLIKRTVSFAHGK